MQDKGDFNSANKLETEKKTRQQTIGMRHFDMEFRAQLNSLIKYITIILFPLFLSQHLSAQDQITRTNGKVISCKIISVDSSRIVFNMQSFSNEVITSLKMEEISSYKYQGNYHYLKEENQIDESVTIDTSNKYGEDIEYAERIERLNRYFVYTFSNEIIPGGSVEYRKSITDGRSIFEKPHFIIGPRKIVNSEVKFYKNEDGFFANTKDLSGSSVYAERIVKGRINLYERVTVSHNPGHFNTMNGMYTGGGFTTKKIRDYYNFGFNDLRKANYKNLRDDLSANSNSLALLNKYKSASNAQITFMIIGGLAVIGGIAGLISTSGKDYGNDSPTYTGVYIAVGAGVVCEWIGYFISLSKPKHLKSAIIEYNRL